MSELYLKFGEAQLKVEGDADLVERAEQAPPVRRRGTRSARPFPFAALHKPSESTRRCSRCNSIQESARPGRWGRVRPIVFSS